MGGLNNPFSAGSSLYAVIATQTLGADAAAVTFSAIPAYKFLKLICLTRKNAVNNTTMTLTLNNDATANYDNNYFTQVGAVLTGSTANGESGIVIGQVTQNTSSPSITEIDIGNNKNNAYKQASGVSKSANASALRISYGTWNNNADAVSRIDLTIAAGSFEAGSVFILAGRN